MADLSNKALSLLLLIAIVVSVSGTILTFNRLNDASVTGRVTDTDSGKANFSINSSVSIRFNNAVIPFGEGHVNDSSTACIMGTNNSNPTGPNGCIGFNTTVASANLTIENDGNIPVNVSINFTANATTFIGGTSPSLQYRVSNVEGSSCTTIRNGTNFQEVGTSASDHAPTMSRICNTLAAGDTGDLIDIGLWVSIPKTAPTGARTVTVNAIACDDGSC